VNEIVSQSGGTNRTLTYDANGSLINDGSKRTFEWDGANRLTVINYTSTTNRSEFSYDGLSRLVKIVEKSGTKIKSTRKIVWCGMEKCEFRDASDAVTLFVYNQGQVSGSTPYFYTRDHLGSIREMRSTGKKGAVVARFDYDPYGRSTAVISSTLPDFNFTGLYRHAASNLDFAVYRAYDPDLGRWLNRDPIGERGGINLFAYVFNDPTLRTDLSGLQCAIPGPLPAPPPMATTASPRFHQEDFRYYGNWGGPGWTGGQWFPYEDLSPARRARLAPPIDGQDECYMHHDICYSQCRVKNHSTSKDNPTKDQLSAENYCEAGCDYRLGVCLSKLKCSNFHSLVAQPLFIWKATLRGFGR
jgi:RHS repeat-associated protein